MSATTMALLLVGGALIGFLLAVLGAGGSILLLPLLVSGAGLPTLAAVPLSLLVVTLLALGNVGPYIRRRQIAIQPALVLGVPALAGPCRQLDRRLAGEGRSDPGAAAAGNLHGRSVAGLLAAQSPQCQRASSQ
jgi:hypothetical protein